MLDLVIHRLEQMGLGVSTTLILDEETSEFQVLLSPDKEQRERSLCIQCSYQALVYDKILKPSDFLPCVQQDMKNQILEAQKQIHNSTLGISAEPQEKMGYHLQFAFEFPFSLQAAKISEMLRLVCFLNNSLNIQGFSLDEVQNGIYYRSGAFFNAEGIESCLAHLGTALFFIHTYYDLLDRMNHTPLTFYSWLQEELLPSIKEIEKEQGDESPS